FMRGRMLFVAMSVGNVAVSGGIPGTALANPGPVNSPLFSSVLAIHFSAAVEKNTQGFALALADHQTLAEGGKVTLSNSEGEKLTIEMVADFPNYTANPSPALPAGIRVSNPFDIVVVDDYAYVTDGGQNCVRKVDLETGAHWVLATFPNIPNPMFGMIGGPFSEAVPTGIRAVDGVLLVTLFRGVPFAPGTSNVVAVDPATGAWASFIGGLKTAIDVLSMPVGLSSHDYLVLQHASVGPFFASPGQLLGFDDAGGSKTVIADCMTRPTSMALDAQTGILYVVELGGRVLAIPMAQ
ncbi:MAG TPA: ScyD/ScyE family protein, partial [Opitutaceae bacterium]